MAWARKQYHNDTDEATLQLIRKLITGKDIIVRYEMFSVSRISKPNTSLQ